MVFHRVEHVERVEMGGKPQIGTNQHKSEGGICEDMCGFVVNSRVEHVEDFGDGVSPHTPNASQSTVIQR